MANDESMRIVLKPDDAEIVRRIMSLTGVSTGSDAVGMLLKKCGNRFINWWDTGCLVPATQEVQLSPLPVATPEPTQIAAVNYSEPITW
jgi:hypothetical protein